MGWLRLLKGDAMTKKEMSRYYWLKHEIQAQKKRLERLRNKKQEGIVGDIVNDYKTGKGIPIKIEGIPSDEFSRPVMMRILEEEIEKNIKESEIAMRKIERHIQTIDNPRLREVMRSRFIDCLSWEMVGRKNYISPDYARQLINKHFNKYKNMCKKR